MLNDISVDLGMLGRHADGLPAAEEAVKVFRALGGGEAAGVLQDLARALQNQA